MSTYIDQDWIECGHSNCHRRAKHIYAYERYGSEFRGQAHDCCGSHNEKLLTQEELYGGAP